MVEERQPQRHVWDGAFVCVLLSPTLLGPPTCHRRVEPQQGQPSPCDDWNGTPRMKVAGLPWPVTLNDLLEQKPPT